MNIQDKLYFYDSHKTTTDFHNQKNIDIKKQFVQGVELDRYHLFVMNDVLCLTIQLFKTFFNMLSFNLLLFDTTKHSFEFLRYSGYSLLQVPYNRVSTATNCLK